jgi:hypothetical protein
VKHRRFAAGAAHGEDLFQVPEERIGRRSWIYIDDFVEFGRFELKPKVDPILKAAHPDQFGAWRQVRPDSGVSGLARRNQANDLRSNERALAVRSRTNINVREGSGGMGGGGTATQRDGGGAGAGTQSGGGVQKGLAKGESPELVLPIKRPRRCRGLLRSKLSSLLRLADLNSAHRRLCFGFGSVDLAGTPTPTIVVVVGRSFTI